MMELEDFMINGTQFILQIQTQVLLLVRKELKGMVLFLERLMEVIPGAR